MTHPDIDIETLWQSQAPVVDSDAVLNHIRSEMRAQRLLDIAYAAVIGLSLVLTGYFELAGAYRFPRLLFGAVAASGVAFAWWRIRQRTRLPETASLAPKAFGRGKSQDISEGVEVPPRCAAVPWLGRRG